MMQFSGKSVTVAGLGRFGGNIAAARWLVEQGANVTVTDREAPEKLKDSIEQLTGLPIAFHLGGHRHEDFTKTDLLVASPAIPPTNPYLIKSREAGVPITTEVRLFIERCPAKILGVTGTKGKSTTTTLLGMMLNTLSTINSELGTRNSELNIWVGGNLGGSLLFDLPQIKPSDLVVLELSSFMLEHLRPMQWSPHVALLTMLASDHLDWHGSAEAYIAAKKVILQFQHPDDFAVIPRDPPLPAGFFPHHSSRITHFPLSASRPFLLKIPGAHNQLNAQAAFAAASCLGVTWENAQRAIADFPGLPHRLQLVHEQDGVRWINDSIATIPQAAVAALESFSSRTVLQIVGGYDKGLPFDCLCQALSRRAKAVLCIGVTGPRILQQLSTLRENGSPSIHDCGDLAAAIATARQHAAPGDTVLLSTGCASYDQFPNFEKRGETFASLAKV